MTRRVSFTSRSRCTPVSVISQQSHLSKIEKNYWSSLDRRYAHRREEDSENEVRGKPSPRDYIFQRNPPEDYEMLETTMDWVQNVVIGLNLCPFAERPLKRRELKLELIRGHNEEEILAQVLGECLVKQSKPGTSLMICPDLYPEDFESFLGVYNVLNDGVLVNQNLTDDVQIAPFHPFFRFDGSQDEDVDNYTNRSPYPIFHILREDEVGRAVDVMEGDASVVWRRNIELLEELEKKLDYSELEQVMKGGKVPNALKEKVRGILQELKRKNS